MISKIYSFFVCMGSILSWVAWFFIVWNIDPVESGKTGMLFFYTSLSMAVVGTYLLLFFLIYHLFLKQKENFLEFLKKNVSQAFIVMVVSIVILFLFHSKLVVWWNATLLILSLIVFKVCLSINRKYAE